MATVQDTYTEDHRTAVAGQVANMQTCDITSLRPEGSTGIRFGRAVRRGTEDGRCMPGVQRVKVSEVRVAMTNAANALTLEIDAVDAATANRIVGRRLRVNGEVMRVSGIDAGRDSVTVIRSAHTRAAHAVNADVYLEDEIDFQGIAVLDKTLEPGQDDQYVEGDVASILNRGDIWVQVEAAVTPDTPPTVDMATGQFGSATPAADQIAIPDASYQTTAAAAGLARLRLHRAPSAR